MFLDRLARLNPALAAEAVRLHQGGSLLANTYLIDGDAISRNAAAISDAASRHGLQVYAMTKQFGRNPDATGAVVEGGIRRAVAVDIQCLEALRKGRLAVGHAGHLVQPYRGAEDAVLAAGPEVVTVFNLDVARRIGAAAVRANREQAVLLRVTKPGDFFYFGQNGGFDLDGIESSAAALDSIDGIRVAGVTSFPVLVADFTRGRMVPTPNFETVRTAANRLRHAGFDIDQVNAPGNVAVATIPRLAAGGATHVEPGHSLQGTSPAQLLDPSSPEIPAVVYVTEVGHIEGDVAYIFAGGIYIGSTLGEYTLRAFCGRDERALDRVFEVEAPLGALHYYVRLRSVGGHDVRVGDTVVFCFRAQAFMTRARTQTVLGLSQGRSELGGRYDIEARLVDGVS